MIHTVLMSLRRFPLLCAIALGVAGCQFAKLHQELDEIERFANIRGQVIAPESKDTPLVIVVLSERFRREALVDFTVNKTGEFSFWVYPGNYFVGAFQDDNRDYKLQAGEAAGFFGQPSLIPVAASGLIENIEVVLSDEHELSDAGLGDPIDEDRIDELFPELWPGLRNIGVVKPLDDERFAPRYGQMALWEPLSFSLEIGPGLFFLEPYDDKKIPIVFIHGIGGTPRDWLAVVAALDRSRFQPWVLAYESGFPLQVTADYLFEALSDLHRDYGFSRLFLVAHSMGGLVSRAFINRYSQTGSDYLKLFVSFATPWQGHEMASLGVDYAPVAIPAWSDLVPGGEFLQSLKTQPLPDHLDYHLFFSFSGNSLITPGADDGAVSIASQLDLDMQKSAVKIYGFDTDHVDLLRRQEVMDELNRLLDHAY